MKKRTSKSLSLIVVVSLLFLSSPAASLAGEYTINKSSWELKVIVDQGDIVPRAYIIGGGSGGEEGGQRVDRLTGASFADYIRWFSHLRSLFVW